MHFDALTLACMAQELRETMVGGRVQQVVLPNAETIGLEVYQDRVRRYLWLSAQAGAAVIYAPSFKPRRGVETETPLLLLLRKYVRNAALVQVRMPDSTERVLCLDFLHKEQGETSLVAELIGRQANLLLLNAQGRILECVRRVAGAGSRVAGGEAPSSARVLLPGRPYAPPLPQAKLPPLDDGDAAYYTRLQSVLDGGGKLWKVLVENIAGVSPSQARELAWRATGQADAAAGETPLLALLQSLQSLWNPAMSGEGWTPGNVLENDRVVGYVPYRANFLSTFQPQPTLSAAIEAALEAGTGPNGAGADEAAPLDAYAGLRKQVMAQLARARRRLERQLAALAADEPVPGAGEELRAQAEWLLALHAQIQPDDRELTVELGADSGVPGVDADGFLRVPLRAGKKPVEQAQQMFKQAGKWERAARIIPQRRAHLAQDLAFLAQLETDLALAENQPEIAAVQEELRATRWLPPTHKAGPRPAPIAAPLRFLTPQGFEVVVGRNARQNEQVTFQVAQSEDMWLHARGVPGAHVVLRTGGQTPQPETLTYAAQLAAYYSQARGERAATVIVTPRKFIARAPGGRKGQVTVRQEETLTVVAVLPDEVQSID